MAVQPFIGPYALFQFHNLYTVGRTPWTGDQPVARPLPTHRTIETQNERTQTFMPWVEFEPMTPVFERAKIVHALDRTATVISKVLHLPGLELWPLDRPDRRQSLYRLRYRFIRKQKVSLLISTWSKKIPFSPGTIPWVAKCVPVCM
jgi:hypothetical protein